MFLASIFQDGAVLQRDMDIPVWGKCAPGQTVKCEFDGVVSVTRSSAAGDFRLYLPAHPAGGPFELTVFIPGDSGEKVVCRDILVGEVWLASGQSNMEYTLGSRICSGGSGRGKVADEQEKLFREMIMDPEQFRIFTVPECTSGAEESTCGGRWQKVSPDNCGGMSAVASWFGMGLQYQLGVPIGIISSAKGGTIAEAWMSYQALCAAPETAGYAAGLRKIHWHGNNWEKSFTESSLYDDLPEVQKDSGNSGEAMGYADTGFDDSLWQTMKIPGSWIKQYISGNGAIWVRKYVEIPDSWAGCDLLLTGGTVDKHDISYFNGKEIGRTGKDFDTEYWNAVRNYSIPGELVKGGRNCVAIRAFSFAHDGSINGEWELINQSTGEKIALNGQWRVISEYDRGKVECKRAAFGPGNPNTPGILFNGMIRPLIPGAIRGVIWYQGESNADTLKNARKYRDIMQALIDDWRRQWGLPRMPFIMVQLAGYGEKKSFLRNSIWAELRESQRLLAKDDPDTYMVSAIDIGDENDIHPQNKRDVGKRLAMCALHHIYDCTQAVPSGPEIVKASARADHSIILEFACAEGLKLTAENSGLFLVSENGTCQAAENVKVDNNTIILSGGNAADAAEVYYAWADFPENTIYNAAGSPAASFRIKVDKA